MQAQTLDPEVAVAIRPEDVKQALARSGWPTIRFVSVRVDGQVVILSGCVKSYHEKQVAYCLARRVPGVYEVKDYVEIFGD